MARLHRTPVHAVMLRAVWEGRITWDQKVGPACNTGGFRWSNGARLQPGDDLVALYELRDAGLILVSAGGVTVSCEGAARLAEWEQVRA